MFEGCSNSYRFRWNPLSPSVTNKCSGKAQLLLAGRCTSRLGRISQSGLAYLVDLVTTVQQHCRGPRSGLKNDAALPFYVEQVVELPDLENCVLLVSQYRLLYTITLIPAFRDGLKPAVAFTIANGKHSRKSC